MRSLAFAVGDRSGPTVALLGFLIRGGLVLLLLPIMVLPTPTNIVSMTGIDAISIAGQPTPWLITAGIVVVVLAVVWVLAACLVGSLADYWLIELATRHAGAGQSADAPRADDEPDGEPKRATLELPPGILLLKMAAIRLVTLVPLAIAIGWATTRLFVAGYDQLITPVDLATPLPVRIVAEAMDAVIVLVIVFLAVETIGALAVRIEVRTRAGFWRSLLRSFALIRRHPVATLVTLTTTYLGSFLAVGATMLLSAIAFDWCRAAARNQEPISIWLGIGYRDFRPLAFILVACVLAAAWLLALVVAGVTSAWRSAAFTAQVWREVEPPERGVIREPGDRTGWPPEIPD